MVVGDSEQTDPDWLLPPWPQGCRCFSLSGPRFTETFPVMLVAQGQAGDRSRC